MNNDVLCEIYGLLKSIGAVQNESEFCKDWLKRSDSYMRQLRFNQAVATAQPVWQSVQASCGIMENRCETQHSRGNLAMRFYF